jgi:hypothetical protein
MVKKWLVTLSLLALLLVVLAIWLVPVVAAKVPSRYIARLPLPIQELIVPEHAELLPTAAVPVDIAELLEPTPTLDQLPLPITLTPVATAGLPTETAPAAPPTETPIPTETPAPIAPAARIAPIHHEFQTWNNCGPATLAMSLSYFGLGLSQYDTAEILKPNIEDRNVSIEEMAAYVNRQTGGAVQAISRTNGNLDTLRRLLAMSVPVIVEVGIDPPGEYAWNGWYGHYLLVVAYDDAQQKIWVYDSWFGTSEVPGENATTDGRIMSYEDLEFYWRQFNRNYLALYRPEQATAIAEVIGSNMDDATMWQRSLELAQSEAEAEPDNAYLWFNLGTNYNAAGDYERAAAAFDQARAIGLPWRMLWYQFGPYEAYLQVGRYEDVVILADATLETEGGKNVEETYYYKGLAQVALGDADGARTSLERAIVLNPNFSRAAEALTELTG